MLKKSNILLVVIFVVLIIVLVSIAEQTNPSPPDSTQTVIEISAPSRLLGVASTGNTSVKLYFEHALNPTAADASLYQIFRPQLCDETNWYAQLRVSKAELSPDGLTVTLTTAPQAGVAYLLTFSGLYDSQGNPVPAAGAPDTPQFFTGTAGAQAVQSDQDGVSDADEQVGWAVRTLSHSLLTACRDVNSDPSLEDTDGDGVADNVEMGYATDPRSPDTDGDDLSDYAEIYTYFSSPLHTDTDKDGLLDGTEAHQLFTSPALADTDGDGVSDAVEIASGGTNPRLADLPELALDLYGSPSIILNMTDEDTKTKLTVETTLEQDRQEQVNTDNSSTKMSIENTVKLHTEVKAGTGTGGWPPSASAELTTDTEFKHGYFHETASNWTNQSVTESKDTFEAKTENIQHISYDDGMLWVPMKITNNSALTFKVKDLRVIAYRMLPNGSFNAVGTLTPGEKTPDNTWERDSLCTDPADASTCGHVLGPGSEIVLVMGADALPAQEMRALVADPSALMFEVGSYSLFQLDEWGVQETVNYARLGESVIQRTGILVIDFGDGTVERYAIATNTERNADGSGKGVTLAEALRDVLGLTDYELCADGKSLCRIKEAVTFRCDEQTLPAQIPVDFCPPATRPITVTQTTTQTITETEIITTTDIPLGFWMVAGSGPEFERQELPKFDEIVLYSGERISLVYLLDSDGDGIFDREEYLLGTDKSNVDSDGDELSDYDETKVGWQVSVQGQDTYQVYSDPRYPDFDGDFLSDLSEFSLGTDPSSANTDGDEFVIDSADPDPLRPPCMEAAFMALTAWWDGSQTAADIITGEPQAGVQSNGTIIGDSTQNPVSILVDWKVSGNPEERVFRFNPASPSQRDQCIQVADTEENHASIHSEREFSLAAWVNWMGLDGTGASQATILAKGTVGVDNNPNSASDDSTATYSLSILPDGKLKFTIHRSVHEKIYYCWFGRPDACDDNAYGDKDYNQVVVLTSKGAVTKGVWTQVAVTFGGEKMRVYLNGQMDNEVSTTREWWSEWNVKNLTYTKSLISNPDPLLIGLDKLDTPKFPYRGTLDDIQFFIRMLQPDEVLQLYNLGVCAP